MRTARPNRIKRLGKVLVLGFAGLAGATLVLSAMSFLRRDLVGCESHFFGGIWLENRIGGLRLTCMPVAQAQGITWTCHAPGTLLSAHRTSALGIALYRSRVTVPSGEALASPCWTMTVPHWLLFSTFAGAIVLPARRMRIDWYRRQRGLCLGCGYDLRATPRRCPECGRAG